jgi:hypothetical protein
LAKARGAVGSHAVILSGITSLFAQWACGLPYSGSGAC